MSLKCPNSDGAGLEDHPGHGTPLGVGGGLLLQDIFGKDELDLYIVDEDLYIKKKKSLVHKNEDMYKKGEGDIYTARLLEGEWIKKRSDTRKERLIRGRTFAPFIESLPTP